MNLTNQLREFKEDPANSWYLKRILAALELYEHVSIDDIEYEAALYYNENSREIASCVKILRSQIVINFE